MVLRVLHIAASMTPEWGGPVSALAGLTRALSDVGVESTVFAATGHRVGAGDEAISGANVRLFSTGVLSPVWTAHAPSMAPAIKEALKDHDIVHVHELWHYPAYAASEAARDLGKPYVVTVHGGLSDWALNHKALKKRIYMVLAQRRMMEGAASLQAFTGAESDQIRQRGFQGTVRIIPNGVDAEQFGKLVDTNEFVSRYPETQGKRIVLFMGRLHPGKGLDILIAAFRDLAENRPDAHLVIAGPDDGGYRAEVERILESSSVREKTTLTGMLKETDRLAAFSVADIFVLPSYSEGFSMTILEALAAGLPVVISRQCNFPEISEEGAGLVVNTSAVELTEALARLFGDTALRESMGHRGRQMVAKRYSWDRVARQIVDMYTEAIRVPAAVSNV